MKYYRLIIRERICGISTDYGLWCLNGLHITPWDRFPGDTHPMRIAEHFERRYPQIFQNDCNVEVQEFSVN